MTGQVARVPRRNTFGQNLQDFPTVSLQSFVLPPFLHGLDAVGMTAAIVLGVMSVGTWYVIAAKAWRSWQIRRHAAEAAAACRVAVAPDRRSATGSSR